MALIAILTVIFLLSLPRLSNIVYTPNVTASQNVIEVKFESDAAFWIAEASVSVNGCNSSVIVVQGKTCNELPTTEKFHTGHDTKVASGSQIYFLENSYMNLSVINRKNSVVWILNKKDFLESKSGANITEKCDTLHKCPRHDGESCCYRIQDYPEGKIQHQITKPDFYFAVPRPYYFYHTFDVSYSIVAYDPDAIVHLPGAEVFQKSAKISDWFQFDTTKCILLNTTCPITVSGFLPISVANVSKRKDVLVLVLMLEFIVSIVGAGITLLCKLTLLKGKRCPAKRSSTTFEELGPTDATALIESNSSPDKVYVTVSTNSFRSIN